MNKALRRLSNRGLAALGAIFVLIIIGTISYRHIEDWSWADSFYFSVVTLTTVGYGDLHPTTEFSRVFTAVYILIGVTVVVTSLGVLGAGYINDRSQKVATRRERKDEDDQEV